MSLRLFYTKLWDLFFVDLPLATEKWIHSHSSLSHSRWKIRAGLSLPSHNLHSREGEKGKGLLGREREWRDSRGLCLRVCLPQDRPFWPSPPRAYRAPGCPEFRAQIWSSWGDRPSHSGQSQPGLAGAGWACWESLGEPGTEEVDVSLLNPPPFFFFLPCLNKLTWRLYEGDQTVSRSV